MVGESKNIEDAEDEEAASLGMGGGSKKDGGTGRMNGSLGYGRREHDWWDMADEVVCD